VRVAVTGGRYYNDRKHVFAVLDEIHSATPITVLIEGGATGADTLAAAWAHLVRERDHTGQPRSLCLFANWQKHGRAAGPIRNQEMIDVGKPDLLVAFPGGRGTADMVRRARAAGIYVYGMGRGLLPRSF